MARVRVKVKDNLPQDAARSQDVPAEDIGATSSPPETAQIPEPLQVDERPAADLYYPNERLSSPKSGIIISPRALVIGCIGFLLIAAIIILVNRDDPGTNKPQVSTPAAQSAIPDVQAEATKYHQEISQYVEVPQDQTPSLVAVSDPAKLAEKSPVLFKNAQKDDVVLFYLNTDKTGKAILYRPSTKKLIAIVDGVNLNSGTDTEGTSPAPIPSRTTR